MYILILNKNYNESEFSVLQEDTKPKIKKQKTKEIL